MPPKRTSSSKPSARAKAPSAALALASASAEASPPQRGGRAASRGRSATPLATRASTTAAAASPKATTPARRGRPSAKALLEVDTNTNDDAPLPPLRPPPRSRGRASVATASPPAAAKGRSSRRDSSSAKESPSGAAPAAEKGRGGGWGSGTLSTLEGLVGGIDVEGLNPINMAKHAAEHLVEAVLGTADERRNRRTAVKQTTTTIETTTRAATRTAKTTKTTGQTNRRDSASEASARNNSISSVRSASTGTDRDGSRSGSSASSSVRPSASGLGIVVPANGELTEEQTEGLHRHVAARGVLTMADFFHGAIDGSTDNQDPPHEGGRVVTQHHHHHHHHHYYHHHEIAPPAAATPDTTSTGTIGFSTDKLPPQTATTAKKIVSVAQSIQEASENNAQLLRHRRGDRSSGGGEDHHRHHRHHYHHHHGDDDGGKDAEERRKHHAHATKGKGEEEEAEVRYETLAEIKKRFANGPIRPADGSLPLYTFEQAPPWMQHNPFILTAYRCHYSVSMCLRSLFSVHNETANVWTHLLGLIGFIFLSVYCFLNILKPQFSHMIIFLLFSLGNVLCMGFSAAFHLFAGHHCERVYSRMIMMDYFGITSLIIGSFYPICYYAFSCDPLYRWLYMGIITALGLVGLIGPFFDFFLSDDFSTYRLCLFVGLAGSGVFPLVHVNFLMPQHSVTPFVQGVALMLFLYGCGVVLYVFKLPERLRPGRFDVLFHSHQLWHVFVLAASMVHFFTCISTYQRWEYMDSQC